MGDAEFWIKLLFQYGPFALIILFFFVGERKAFKALKTADKTDKKLTRRIYGSVWGAIFVLGIVCTGVWINNFLSPAPVIDNVIRGTVAGLTGRERMESHEVDLFTHKKPFGETSVLYFRIETDERLQAGKKVRFTFNRGLFDTEGETELVDRRTGHELVIREEYYTPENRIEMVYENNKLFIKETGGVPKELVKIASLPDSADTGIPSPEHAGSPALGFPFVSTAHAQDDVPAPLSPEPLSKKEAKIFRLQIGAESILVQDDAVKRLAGKQENALPLIEQILGDRWASPEELLGALQTLNRLEPAVTAKIDADTREQVIALTLHPIRDIRIQALRALLDHPSADLADRLLERYRRLEAQSTSRLSQVNGAAQAAFEVGYLVAFREKNAIAPSAPLDEKVAGIEAAFARLDAIKTAAETTDTHYHQVSPRLEWARGLLHAEIAFLDPPQTGERLERTAAHFEAFVAQAKPEIYSNQTQIDQAVKFAGNPSLDVLQDLMPKTLVVYYKKPADGDKVEVALSGLDIPVDIRTYYRNDVSANAIWFGAWVPFEEAKSVALSLVQNGIGIRRLFTFTERGKKANIIEIGASPDLGALPVLTPETIASMTADQVHAYPPK